MTEADADLRMLLDERAIERVYLRYCDIIDSKTFPDLREVFTEGCRRHYLDVHGQREVRDPAGDGSSQHGLASLVERLERSGWHRTHHNVLNFRITVDGGRARAKVHYYAVHQIVADGPILSLWGEYDDDLLRTPAGWRVDERRYSTWLREGDWANRPGLRDGKPVSG